MAESSARELKPIRSVAEPPSLRLIAGHAPRSPESLLDALELREVLSDISMNATSVEVAVAHGPPSLADKNLRLHHVHLLLLQHRVRQVTIVYRIAEGTRTERFVCSVDGFAHSRELAVGKSR